MLETLSQIVGENQVKTQEPMSRHTTFRVGGPAAYYVTPKTTEQIAKVIQCCKTVPYYVIGNGSNLLVSDRGYEGVILEIGSEFSDFWIEGTKVKAQAGVRLAKLAQALCEESLQGFEFASGIPGTLGGAVTMNAGAYGEEIKDVIVSATVLDAKGMVLSLSKEELDLGYRHSIVSEKNYIVLEAEMDFSIGDKERIKEKMADLGARRREKQPLEYPSAGSTFKRPEGYFAGKLIQDAGLSGFQVGGAQVSEKHCGFVINANQAKAEDIYQLILQVQEKVQETSGVWLEPEVKMIGWA